MKKIFILSMTGALLATPVTAAQQCINNNWDHCSFYYEEDDSYAGMRWAVASDDDGCPSLVSGVALLTSGDADIRGTTANQYTYDQTYQGFEGSSVCVCIMTYPYRGRFFVVPLSTVGSNAEPGYCAQNCSYSFIEDDTFRNLVLTQG